ncbi:MAG TPA: hypothetical protein VIL30_18100 [Ramlibacter sp.]|jgi:hypothetical protein
MKLVAINTVNLGGGKSAAPGGEFEIADSKEAEALIAAGAASRKTKTVADDSDSDSASTGDPATDPSLPASGSTQAPDPDAVAAANKSAKRTS